MKDDYTTNSHYFTYTFLFKRLGECTFNLGVKELIEVISKRRFSPALTTNADRLLKTPVKTCLPQSVTNCTKTRITRIANSSVFVLAAFSACEPALKHVCYSCTHFLREFNSIRANQTDIFLFERGLSKLGDICHVDGVTNKTKMLLEGWALRRMLVRSSSPIRVTSPSPIDPRPTRITDISRKDENYLKSRDIQPRESQSWSLY